MSARSSAGFIKRRRAGNDERHGTPAGAHRHSLAGEPPCDACRAAKAEYDRERLKASDKAIRNRRHAKAQSLALRDLRRLHPEEYQALYLAHKESLLREVTANP